MVASAYPGHLHWWQGYYPIAYHGHVVTWQECLRFRKGFLIACDGQFGPATRDATCQVQMALGLYADGYVDMTTWTRAGA